MAHEPKAVDSHQEPDGKAPPKRRRGRPAVTSLEEIVRAGLELAAAAPDRDVSIAAIARSLGIAPMAIYNYVRDKDDLLQELSDALLRSLVVVPPADATPEQMIRCWGETVRRHFLQHPELLRMLVWEEGRSSAAWLNKSEVLFAALNRMEIPEDRWGMMVHWLWCSVMGLIRIEIDYNFDRTSPQVLGEAREKLRPEVAQGVSVIVTGMKSEGYGERFFGFFMDRLMDGIAGATRDL